MDFTFINNPFLAPKISHLRSLQKPVYSQTFSDHFHGTLEIIKTRMLYFSGVVMKNNQTSSHFHILWHHWTQR
ncbi:hypothetical protein AV530_005666 [Patagioenas fasciata monilis]|uniref:Uncharacterized protein n=1 Tax=Patagioenas fasciata monilis TaxID=372326 RepID=A0A1V4JM80_PATFA|nr:hypothetical protein AV530_005666 [Patagioenas fasciata monilis]